MGIEVDGANQKLILDSDGDTYIEGATDDTLKVYVSGAQDFTITANTLTAESGSTIAAQALTATTVTASGIVKTDDATEATSTTDGSLQTDGGLSVVKDAVFGDDLKLLSDASVIHFGANSEITLTHSHDSGLLLKHTATADDKPINLVLQTGETDMAANDVIGKISFQAPDEGTGTDAILVSAAIQAVAEGDHSSSSNATRIEFMVGASETAAKKMQLTSAGKLEVDGGIDIEGGAVFNEDSADVDFRIESNGNANMFVVNGGGDRVGIGADPDLGVGLHIKTADSSASANGDADELVIENGTSGAGVGISLLSATNGEARINFGDSDDDNAGQIFYNHGNNTLSFHANASERMRLSSDGNVFVGKTSGGQDSAGIKMEGANGAILCTRDGAVAGIFTRLSDDGEVIRIMKDTSTVGTISVSGSSTAYNTSSDYRLKENEVAISDGITRLKTLKPYRFNFKSNPDTKVDGFLAHEVTAVPEAISGTKDKTETKEKLILDKDNNILEENKEEADWIKGKEKGYYPSDSTWVASKVYPVYQGIDQSKLVPLLTAALQEAITEIESLEARVTTLEG
jgi:hypothetical protein